MLMNPTDNIVAVRRKQLAIWVAQNTIPQREKSLFSQLLNGKSSFGERVSRRLERDYNMVPFFLDGFNLGTHPLQTPTTITYGYIDHRANYTHISVYDVQPANHEQSLVWLERPNEGPILIKKSGLRAQSFCTKSCKALFVRGDSMQPELNDWDIIVIDTHDVAVIDGEIYAVTYNGQLFIKKLVRSRHGIQLISINPLYPPLYITETKPPSFMILGRKIWRCG